MSELFGMNRNKKEKLKELIKKLHKGASIEDIKREFKIILGDVSPVEISQLEEELISEGMAPDEIHRLCDVHISTFRESLNKVKLDIPEWHPLHILMDEHERILGIVEKLRNIVNPLKGKEKLDKNIETLKKIINHLKESESHYLREENVIFPHMEKHGITQPPAIMWEEHNTIRKMKKNIIEIFNEFNQKRDTDTIVKMDGASVELYEMLTSHFYKENNILFPTALQVIEENEWKEMRSDFDEIGYCCFTPVPVKPKIEKVKIEVSGGVKGDVVNFESGELAPAELGGMLNALPIDITFVDKNDRVKFFNKGDDRVFVRTKAVIGRTVQQCHPQKSIHIVNKIVEDFKSGKKDVVSFWLNLKGRLIYIRYFAVRDKNNEYLGTIEVTQDITDIKKIEGEKRLMEGINKKGR